MSPQNLIVASEEKFTALFPVVPPLMFDLDRERGVLHLSLDFFRNDWMVGESARIAGALPSLADLSIHDNVDESSIEGTWFEAMGYKDDSFDCSKFEENALPPPRRHIAGAIQLPKKK